MKKELLTGWRKHKDYFKSKEAYVIFALLETDGETRNRLLGIKKTHYLNSKKADEWYEYINKIITEEHPYFCEAHSELLKIRRRMKGQL